MMEPFEQLLKKLTRSQTNMHILSISQKQQKNVTKPWITKGIHTYINTRYGKGKEMTIDLHKKFKKYCNFMSNL